MLPMPLQQTMLVACTATYATVVLCSASRPGLLHLVSNHLSVGAALDQQIHAFITEENVRKNRHGC